MTLFRYSILLSCLLLSVGYVTQAQSKQQLHSLLGNMPAKPHERPDTLEKLRIDNGWRYHLKFLAEDSSTLLHTPKDFIYAYLFVPDAAARQKLPGMVAIHQDGSHNYLGYLETAGIAGDADQHYGLELYTRGYIVICPDRFLHNKRRRIANPDTLADVFDKADLAEQHWVGQLLSTGRNFIGKEVYDLMLATDVLMETQGIDRKRIGAVGHSAGGQILPYFMFADRRITAGISSCGVVEQADWFAEDAISKRNLLAVIPSFTLLARTSDFMGRLAPRPLLLTRGLFEWGKENSRQRENSKRHVASTLQLVEESTVAYKAKNVGEHLQTIYFDEEGGRHSFPPGVKAKAFGWLDKYLKTP
ncbi:MAG: prolyl oligopeptidase family serine peptidase [Rhizobacter sp.]|nr:prolyl oligopeptidase family serine peptidase [Ferruginibacter sp.]